MASIVELQDELVLLVKEVPAFSASGFSVFDVDDLLVEATQQTFPLVGVAYDGGIPAMKGQGNQATPVAQGAGGASLVTMQFTIILAVQYHYGGQDDTKPQAMALLDAVRAKVLGFKGVNTRPWVFVGEKPEPGASGDGVVFYSQLWQTTVPVVGDFNKSV